MAEVNVTEPTLAPLFRHQAILVRDNSMEPELPMGWMAVIDPGESYGDGDIVLVRMRDGTHYFREYRAMSKGTFNVSSLQPPKTSQGRRDAITVLARVTGAYGERPSRAAVSATTA